jgi:hypothetical protein
MHLEWEVWAYGAHSTPTVPNASLDKIKLLQAATFHCALLQGPTANAPSCKVSKGSCANPVFFAL